MMIDDVVAVLLFVFDSYTGAKGRITYTGKR